MSASLVGSEMCIRDRTTAVATSQVRNQSQQRYAPSMASARRSCSASRLGLQVALLGEVVSAA
eukprot:14591986-Alexandrium_andersonii.AAC.1